MSKHIHKFFLFVLVIGLPFSLTQCSSSSGDDDDDDDNGGTTALEGLASCAPVEGSSVICGTVYAADGVTPVAGATISLVESSGNISALRSLTANEVDCLTDDVGAFACLTDAEGNVTFQISGSFFSTAQEFTAECNSGETTEVESALTTADPENISAQRWLVIRGAFDGIQLLLSQLKGCTLTGEEEFPESLTGSDECEDAGLFVSDDPSTDLLEDLSDYQAIFANCSADYSFVAGVTEALQSYVNDGGNIYFSDLADSWLTTTFPSQIEFAGNDTDSGTLDTAVIIDDGLAAFLGGSSTTLQSTMSIEFNLGVWTAIDSVTDVDWTTFIEGDLTDLTSYAGTHPITVGGPKDDGCIFYTSYHVETGTSQGADQELALKYLILNRMNNCGEDTGGDDDACDIASCDSDSDCQQLAADDASFCGVNQAGSPISDCMTCVEECCEVTE